MAENKTMKKQQLFGKSGWTPDRIGSLESKTYVITGANTGAGFEATRLLLAKSARVLMLNRNTVKSAAAIAKLKEEFGADAQVSFVQMDLAEQDSVRKAAAQALQQLPQIDALICNGAIAQVAKQELTVDGFESQLGVNHYGHFLLCGLLFPHIEASTGRIVVVASEGYKMGLKTIQFDDMNWDKNYHPNRTYCHSKLAQMIFAYELQNRLGKSDSEVKVYVCHPGASKTSLINEKTTRLARIVWSIMAASPIVQSAEKGAYPEVMCATEESLNQQAYYGPSGLMNWIGPVGECELEPFVLDREVATKLWALSEQETSFNWSL